MAKPSTRKHRQQPLAFRVLKAVFIVIACAVLVLAIAARIYHYIQHVRK